ncbi:hypothetical protein [Methylobacterium sp. Leaf466]|uniref:hypothetical protein n=1 Tax=Methylobacterium sp. Leaf466 TaxID=1736386 RepID=UPI0012E35454|nr:hypothetical protein [Methylobacterium sp. Leaf466]
MGTDIYGLLQERLTTALGDLPRCRVREDAAKIGLFLARLAPRDVESFAFATTIQDHPRFRVWCGSCDSNGKPWTRQRIRSCRDALVRVEFILKMNDDTVCYFVENTKTFRDTPNHFRFGPEYGSILAPTLPKTPSAASSSAPVLQVEPPSSPPLSPAIRPSRDIILAPLVAVVKDRVIFGRVRSDIIRVRAAKREAARAQHHLPIPLPSIPTAALAGMKLSAAAASIFKRP